MGRLLKFLIIKWLSRTLRDERQWREPLCWLHRSNHAQEFILSTIGVLHKRVERSEADLFVEVNSASVKGGYAQAPHADGKVFLTKGQSREQERPPQALASQIWSQPQSHLDGLTLLLEGEKTNEFIRLIEDGVVGHLPALRIKQFR